jgi:hypothetical protein
MSNSIIGHFVKMSSYTLALNGCFYFDNRGYQNMKTDYDEVALSKARCYISTFIVKLAQLGFKMSEESLEHLLMMTDENGLSVKMTERDLIELLTGYYEIVKKFVGDDKTYIPFYQNFPREVMEMDDTEILINAILHYVFGYRPEIKPQNTFDSDSLSTAFRAYAEDNDLTIIKVCNKNGLRDILLQNIYAPIAYTPSVKEFISSFISSGINELPIHADEIKEPIPFKENVAFLLSLILNDERYLESEKSRIIYQQCRTATDLLRLIVGLSDGDITLNKPSKIKNLPRKYYRIFMDVMNNMEEQYVLEDMFKYKEQWKAVIEKMHPFKFNGIRYHKAQRCFKAIVTGDKPKMFMGEVNELIKAGFISDAAEKLSIKPGMMARHLDHLLREGNDEERAVVLKHFSKVAGDLNIPLLVQVRDHFIERSGNKKDRFFKVKSGKLWMDEAGADWKDIPEDVCNSVVSICEFAISLLSHDKGYIGDVYIHPSFDGYVIPTSQRQTNSVRPCTTGSRWKFKDDTKTIRLFTWWTNTNKGDRVDVDLSLTLMTDNMENPRLTVLNFHNIRLTSSNGFVAVHSGDITNGGSPDGVGATEFIDIDIEKAISAGYRYAVMSVVNFTDTNFDLFNSRAGVMEVKTNLEESHTGDKLFIPTNVDINIDITANSRTVLPAMVDLVTREIIWCDIADSTAEGQYRDAWSHALRTMNLKHLLFIVNKKRTTMRELISIEMGSRGKIVDSPEKASLICDTEMRDEYANKDVLLAFDHARFTELFM